jgi:hypothetical protein
MQGYCIHIKREEPAAGDSPPHAPPPAPAKGGDDDKDDENEETDEDRWDGGRGGTARATKKRPRPRREGLGAMAVSLWP